MRIFNHTLFPTMVTEVLDFLSAEQCKDLFEYAVSLQNQTKQHGAVCGDGVSYHTTQSLFLDSVVENVPSCANLKNDLYATVLHHCEASGFKAPEKISNSWFNMQNGASSLKTHTHPGSTISGALYINVDENSSPIAFTNPNPFISFSGIADQARDCSYQWYMFQPKIGQLLLFPSWLQHGSNEVTNSTQNRTVISFNSL